MRENCHKGLVRLIGAYGSFPMSNEDLSELIKASIEPDMEKRMNIEKNIQDFSKIVPIIFEWLVKHTIGAKENAILNLRKAKNAHVKNDPCWINFLGRSFHYITDWGTPYHAPISVANPVIAFTIFGTLIMGLIGTIVNRKKGSKKILKSAIKWSLVGAVTSAGSSLVKLYLDHKIFEERCDEFWEKYESMIISKFLSQKKVLHLPKSFETGIMLIDEKMNNLRSFCNNRSPDWILSSDGDNFADYIIQIAIMLDYTVQIIKID